MTAQESANFYRNHFLRTSAAKECYDRLVRQIELGNLAASREVPNLPLHCAVDAHRAYLALCYDRPEFFFLNTIHHTMQRDQTVIFVADEEFPPELVKTVWTEADQLGNQLTSNLPEDLLEREKVLYRRMADLLIYPRDGMLVLNRHNIIDPVMKHKGVCEGIAKFFAIMMRKAGIPAIVITGKTHAWNMVWIHDIPAHCDLTWDLSYFYSPSYFNRTDSILDSSHSPLMNIFPPCRVSPR